MLQNHLSIQIDSREKEKTIDCGEPELMKAAAFHQTLIDKENQSFFLSNEVEKKGDCAMKSRCMVLSR